LWRVDPLVALEADEPPVERGRQRRRHLGLPDARLALEEERLSERDREVDGRGERAIRQVRLVAQRVGDSLDRAERSHGAHGRRPADAEAAASYHPYSLRTRKRKPEADRGGS